MRIEYKDLKVEKVSSGGDSYHDVSHAAWHVTAPPALDVHYIQWGTSNMSGADWCHDLDGSRYDSLQRLLGHEVLVVGAPEDTEAGVYDDGTVDLDQLINEVIEGIEYEDVTTTSPGRPVKVTEVKGKITLSDGSTSEFSIWTDGGWQQWGATQNRLGESVDAMEAMVRGLLEDEVLASDSDPEDDDEE